MDHEPLAGVEGDRIGELHSLKPTAKFRTHESATGISRVNMQPQAVVLTWDEYLLCSFQNEKRKNKNTNVLDELDSI